MWTAAGIVFLLLPSLIVLGLCTYVWAYVRLYYLGQLTRIFEEKPLFIIPRGEPDPQAEQVDFPTENGQTCRGVYWKTTAPDRKGVILFGIEYGSDRWSSRPYCEALIRSGYDVFAYEPRSQGDSDKIAGYEPLQWITRYEVADARSALNYLRSRPDTDPRGVGFFGVSKGANAGLAAMADNPAVRCAVTDGAFGTISVMVPYMRQWIAIYNVNYLTHGLLPAAFYGHIAKVGIRRVEESRKVRFYHLERPIRRLNRPWLMIHGEADSYIKLEMARSLRRRAGGAMDIWVVPKARHNQAITAAGSEYPARVVEFFDRHLAAPA